MALLCLVPPTDPGLLSICWARRPAAKPSIHPRPWEPKGEAWSRHSLYRVPIRWAKGRASLGSGALGTRILGIWVSGLPQNRAGASPLSGRGAEVGVGGEPGTGLGTGSAAEMMAYIAPSDCTPENSTSEGTFHSPRGVCGLGYASDPSPAVLREAAWTEGKTRRGEETTKRVRTGIGAENWKSLKETARSPPPFPPASMN